MSGGDKRATRLPLLAALTVTFGIALASAQIPDQVEVAVVASGMFFPAGLAWSHDGFLTIADSQKREIYQLGADQRLRSTRQDANAVQGLAYDTQSRLYICEPETRKLVRLDKKGVTEVLAANFEGKRLNSPGDVTVRRDGQIYFTDPAFAGAIDHRELSFNGVFHVTPKGEIEAIARWQNRPNGVALSADGKRLFVADADRHAVVEFDLDSKGSAANPRDFVTGIQGVPAGLRVDAAGRLYVSAQGLAIYTPEGKLQRTMMESQRVIACTFGGSDLQTLYVATPKQIFRVLIGVKGVLQY